MQATKRADPHDLKNIFLKVRFADAETFAGLTIVATLKLDSGVTSAFTKCAVSERIPAVV